VLLGVAAGLVLLIACINVANQLLARATGRLRDMAVRAALGGDRFQVLAPSLAESLVVSLLGAAAGLAVATLSLELLRPLVPPDLAQARTLGLHLPTLGLTLATALVTALLCGSAPGLLLLRLNLSQHLKEGSKSPDAPGHRRLRNALVVAQVALALMLASGFSATFLSIQRLMKVPLGIRPEGAAAFSLQASPTVNKDEAARLRVTEQILEAVKGVPGVEEAGWIDCMPPIQNGRNSNFRLRGVEPRETDIAEVRAASAWGLAVLGVPLVRGSWFQPTDHTTRPAEERGLQSALARPGVQDLALPGGAGRFDARRSAFRQGGLPHTLLVLNDLTRPLREEERQAWQRLVRVLSHEFNHSLAPIQSLSGSLADLTRREPPPPDFREDLLSGLEVIASRSGSLQRFLEAYARLAKLPAPRLEPVDLGALMRRVAALETRVPVKVAPGPEVSLGADGDQLRQVLVNLVKNAAEASRETGGGVAVAWGRDGEAAWVAVEDDGLGPPPAANLFVPFFTTKPGGSGIGLALSRQIAEAHGGTLALEPRPDGTGARALPRLPLAQRA
jgi:signal transduction histidine kinase